MSVNKNGDSNRITREYLDSLLIETRYIDAAFPDTSCSFFGEKFPFPIACAALSHLEHFMYEGATMEVVRGVKEAGALLFWGMESDGMMEQIADSGVRFVEIIKPYKDREILIRKIEHARSIGALAVGIDIDHPFSEKGGPDVCDGFEMAPMTSGELKEIASGAGLPLILKGVLSRQDAQRGLSCGAGGLWVSHHNNRIDYALPPLMALPEVRKEAGEGLLIVDGCLESGMDVFKALALGADLACIGRPLMSAAKRGKEQAVADSLKRAGEELCKAMAYTGCQNLACVEASLIHKRNF